MSRLRSAFAIFCIAAIPIFGACTGDVGPAGPAGQDGAGGADGATGPAGPAGSTSLVGFANINTIGDTDSPTGACIWAATGVPVPCVFHFGGAPTDSVNVEKIAVGEYWVKFFGSYGSFVSTAGRHEVVILATITQGDGTYVVSVEQAVSGNACNALGRTDQINTCVRIWQADNPATLVDKNFSVAIIR